ncbi:MAG: SDR family oxidoreductase [Rhodobacteraceae bacterium]|nr:SDR family oxidoreductase [Paracoccaceae bacterium]
MKELFDQTVLVTGARRGIGAACARLLAEKGARVIVSDILSPDETFQDLDAHPKGHIACICDVADDASVDAMFSMLDQSAPMLNALVHCAGIIDERPLLETSTSDFDKVINVNLRGSFLIGREAIRRMQGRKGRVILTSSDLGVSGRETFSSYVASKHGVMGLARSWAKEFAPHILVNALCPGPINTDMLESASMTPEWRARELDIPLERFGHPEEIAQMAAFLIGPNAGFITGQGIGVNGGSVMP